VSIQPNSGRGTKARDDAEFAISEQLRFPFGIVRILAGKTLLQLP
jgi:hypothetical protein